MRERIVEPYAEAVAAHVPPSTLKRVSWGAIFAGAITVLAVQLTLNVFGIGIGAAVLAPGGSDPSAQAIGIGAGIWMLIAALLALFGGGWVAGRLAGTPRRTDAMLHGFVTWGLATVVMVWLLTTTVGGLIGGAASGLGAALQSRPVASMIEQQTGMTPQEIEREAGDVAADPRFQTFVASYLQDGQVEPQDREALVVLVAERRNVTQQQAEQTVSRWEQRLQQARTETVETAEAAAPGVATAALVTFLILLLGAAAAAAGGALGAPKDIADLREPVDIRDRERERAA